MIEGTLQQWLVDDGAEATEGEPLYLLEMDKVEQEILSPMTGVLRHVGEPGEVYEVGALIGEITASG